MVERLVIMSKEPTITADHLPRKYPPNEKEASLSTRTLRDQVDNYELDVIRKTVEHSATLEEAAHRLGISISTLTRRLRTLKIDGQK